MKYFAWNLPAFNSSISSASSLMLFSLYEANDGDYSWTEKIKIFSQSFLMAFVELPFSLGETLEFLLHFDFRFMYKKVVFDTNDLNTAWKYEAWNAWANLWALMIGEIIFVIQL